MSMDALNGKKIRIFYLHAPDRSIPFENTLEAIDSLHKAECLYVSRLFNEIPYSHCSYGMQ